MTIVALLFLRMTTIDPDTSHSSKAAHGLPVPGMELESRLARNRLLATGLLCLMASVYAVTLLDSAPEYLIRLIRTMSEAGIVGGLADWFAVTALFRHPLGIPIPHTAVIPASQARIAGTLGRFISSNFLTRELILRKTRELALGDRLARWLQKPTAQASVTSWVAQLLPRATAQLDNSELREFVSQALGKQLRTADLAGALARFLRVAASSREADILFVQIADTASAWIATNKAQILDMVGQRNRWWIPKPVNRSIAEAIANGFIELLEELRRPESEERAKVLAALIQMSEDLVASPERRSRLDAFVRGALSDPDFKAWMHAIWRSFTQAAIRDVEHPSTATRGVVEKIVASISNSFANDPALVSRVDGLAEHLALVIVARRQDVARIVDEVVRGWDPQVMSQRLELVVGSDLQYIRMNGTLVGAVVGGILFIASHLLNPAV